MGTLEIQKLVVPPMVVPEKVVPRWPLVQRILFRFVFAYLVLFNLFGGNSLLGTLWDGIVLWVGELVFNVEITVRPLGSGDTTWSYVQVFCFLVLAVAATLIWTIFDWKRSNYERLHEWLRVFVRFSLALTMILYGAAKAIPIQMPSPSLVRLVQPFGEASPMGLLWTFMGASAAYCIFTGIAELVGGLLLTVRRTTLLGALVCVGVMGHVFMLNLCYDVPVKLLSAHLFGMAIFLVLPDLRRLADLFVFQRPVEPTPVKPIFASPMANRVGLILRTSFVVLVTGFFLFQSLVLDMAYGDLAPKPPLYGIWNVEGFEVDGEVLPPLLTDATRWQRVIFDYPDTIAIQQMTGAPKYHTLNLDEAKHTLAISKFEDENWKATLTYKVTEPGVLVVEGTFDGQNVRLKLRRVDETQFLLISRGFHWISEQPFNR